MSLFTKRTAPKPTQVERRVARMTEGALFDWVDSAVYGLGRTMADYRKSSEPFYLQEATLAAETLYAITRELATRAEGRG